MYKKKINIYISLAFITGILAIVYIQYNSAESIDALMHGNQQLMREFTVTQNLVAIEKGIYKMESKARGAIASGNELLKEGLEEDTDQLNQHIILLQQIRNEDSAAALVDSLSNMVHNLEANVIVLFDSARLNGREAALRVIASGAGKRLTDSVVHLITKVDSVRQKHRDNANLMLNHGSQRAKSLNTLLAMVFLVSATLFFGYIIVNLRRQGRLIKLLASSEKKARQASLIKENFLANMSHEIRTPMNAILGFTNLLQRRNLDSKSEEYVQTIQKSCESLLTIINDILDLSKIEAGMMRIESVAFSISGLVRSVEAMFSPRAGDKNITFNVFIDETLPDSLEGDPTRLTQILVNLLGNALKFTEHGVIQLKISNEGITDGIASMGIEVTDTGLGIPADKLKGIFERFNQGDDSVNRRFGGTGLGLSIVHELVTLQKGTIQVHSTPGKGSTFRLVIPYRVPVKKLITTSSSPVNRQALHLADTKVLVVEDNDINQQLLKHLFTEWGLAFDIAPGGQQALTLLQHNTYSLVLMDIQMPGMDGYTVTRQIRNVLQLNIPVIAMTAHAMAGEREKCISQGMDEYISKPIREEQLYKLIQAFTGYNIKPQAEASGSTTVPDEYCYIQLAYLRDISKGNKNYEKLVTAEFIEAVPAELLLLTQAIKNKDIAGAKQIAHNLKTTVSIMGIDNVVNAYLDIIEQWPGDDKVTSALTEASHYCSAAVKEAGEFYKTL